MIQVAQQGKHYTVLQDGVANGLYETRGEAVAAALVLKEGSE